MLADVSCLVMSGQTAVWTALAHVGRPQCEARIWQMTAKTFFQRFQVQRSSAERSFQALLSPHHWIPTESESIATVDNTPSFSDYQVRASLTNFSPCAMTAFVLVVRGIAASGVRVQVQMGSVRLCTIATEFFHPRGRTPRFSILRRWHRNIKDDSFWVKDNAFRKNVCASH